MHFTIRAFEVHRLQLLNNILLKGFVAGIRLEDADQTTWLDPEADKYEFNIIRMLNRSRVADRAGDLFSDLRVS